MESTQVRHSLAKPHGLNSASPRPRCKDNKCKGAMKVPSPALKNMRTGPTNTQLVELITALKKKANSDESHLWRRIAYDLEKPSRQRREVNLSRINRYAKDNETIVVPGKVLSSGELKIRTTIAAWQFSKQAIQKISKSDSKAITIMDLLKENPKNKRIRILG